MINETLSAAEDKMKKNVEGLKTDLASIRTGRATPALVEHLKVDYAGATLPLNQLGGISVPEARLIAIQPWDPGSLRAIEKAILASDIGLNPVNDGKVIRLTVPPLSEQRRQEMVKMVKHRAEERRIVVRNLRREAMDALKEAEKKKEISQDDNKRASAQLQKITDNIIATLDKTAQEKETELAKI